MLTLNNVNKYYDSLQALKNVNLSINRGEIVGLFGANGAGKTTLMKSILGLIPFKGSVTIDGNSVSKSNIELLSFATTEHSFFENLNAKEHYDFYQSHFERFRENRFSRLMDFFNLPMNKKIKTFSFGQKNQFEVILSLCQGADYILVDEPFAGNDIFNREDFYKVVLGILEDDETIILSTHLIEEVSSFVDRVLVLDKGAIIEDVSISDIEGEHLSLVDFIKKSLSYEADRVSKMIKNMNDEVER